MFMWVWLNKRYATDKRAALILLQEHTYWPDIDAQDRSDISLSLIWVSVCKYVDLWKFRYSRVYFKLIMHFWYLTFEYWQLL